VEQSIFTFYMKSGAVEESTLQASGKTSLRNSTDGHIIKIIDYVNQAQDKDTPYNTSSSTFKFVQRKNQWNWYSLSWKNCKGGRS
jgi:hypothetical protein